MLWRILQIVSYSCHLVKHATAPWWPYLGHYRSWLTQFTGHRWVRFIGWWPGSWYILWCQNSPPPASFCYPCVSQVWAKSSMSTVGWKVAFCLISCRIRVTFFLNIHEILTSYLKYARVLFPWNLWKFLASNLPTLFQQETRARIMCVCVPSRVRGGSWTRNYPQHGCGCWLAAVSPPLSATERRPTHTVPREMALWN